MQNVNLKRKNMKKAQTAVLDAGATTRQFEQVSKSNSPDTTQYDRITGMKLSGAVTTPLDKVKLKQLADEAVESIDCIPKNLNFEHQKKILQS